MGLLHTVSQENPARFFVLLFFCVISCGLTVYNTIRVLNHVSPNEPETEENNSGSKIEEV